MVSQLIKKVFGSRNQRLLKRYGRKVKHINALETSMQGLSDEALAAKTPEFRQRLNEGATLADLLPEAFAVVREVSVRTLGLRHFDVQLIGGMVLHDGKIAEMRTGEGKTLVSTLPAYLNALTGKGVHIVTVNDYLAKRDAEWMRPIYDFLGISVGINLAEMEPEFKQQAYAADITYGTNNEFGFDYLRDNMAFEPVQQVQRGVHFAIIDEVDSILIDEARTPLIISGQVEDSSDLYIKINDIVPNLIVAADKDAEGDYYLEEKTKQAHLTEQGHQTVEQLMANAGLFKAGESLYAPQNIRLMHHLNAALRAHALYHRDVDYMVKNQQVVIIDEHTGRTLAGRRWSDGLHQAVEAKEGVRIENENQTLASITFQNYFRLYDKLAGMTGTADTEAYELQQIYGLEVVVIPTNKPVKRIDAPDKIYMTQLEKFNAVIDDVQETVAKGRPVLVGTASVEASEFLSQLLSKKNIKHQVLNAKFHQQEAEIIAQAGRPGAITIATNMAGRGTDIVLGGNLEAEMAKLKNPTEAQLVELKQVWQERHDQVIKAGGLHVIGSERHESRRIDNQLRGRCARQGDPGSTRFYLAFEDNLLRIFASERMAAIMRRLGVKDGESIESQMVTRAIENAQRKVEAHNFDIRKELLEYDDVANAQRKVVYQQRHEIMHSPEVAENIRSIQTDVIHSIVQQFIPPQSMDDQWDVPGLERHLASEFDLKLPISQWLADDDQLDDERLADRITETCLTRYAEKEHLVGSDVMRNFEKAILLQCLDNQWKEHLAAMDHLREGIHLRGYAQKDPKQEYKREAFDLFHHFLANLKLDVLQILANVQVEQQADVDAIEEQGRKRAMRQTMEFQHGMPVMDMGQAAVSAMNEVPSDTNNVVTFVRDQPKVGRNEPCPCGSGKKYKHCHGKI